MNQLLKTDGIITDGAKRDYCLTRWCVPMILGNQAAGIAMGPSTYCSLGGGILQLG